MGLVNFFIAVAAGECGFYFVNKYIKKRNVLTPLLVLRICRGSVYRETFAVKKTILQCYPDSLCRLDNLFICKGVDKVVKVCVAFCPLYLYSGGGGDGFIEKIEEVSGEAIQRD